MDYPLQMTKKPSGTYGSTGFAVANSEAEHLALSDAGFEPKLVPPAAPPPPPADEAPRQ